MNPKIVLYNPKSNAAGKKILPMSVLALGAVLEPRYEYSIVDGNLSADPLGDIRGSVREGANVVAVTVMPGPQLSQAYPHCRALKAEFPAVTVVWGGYFPTQHASACLASPAVDYVIRGHGELAFLELLDCFERGDDPGTVQGLAFRDSAGNLVEKPLPPIPHPETLPPVPYHRIDMAQYVRRTFLGSRTMPHHSSYGCPFLCNFCAVVNMVGGRWLPQSAARVAEIADLYVERWRINAIEFHDNNFFTHEARVAEIAERIRPLGLAWWGEGRVDTMLKYSDRTWQTMRDAGLKAVFLGAESASAETLRRMDKGGTLTPEKTLEIAAKMRRYGITPEFSFIVGNPPDPEADASATLGFIRRVKRANPASEIIIYMYSPVPLHGQLYDSAVAGGFSFPEALEEWVDPRWLEFSSRRHARVPWLHGRLRRRIRNFERVLNAYYPTTTDQRLTGLKRSLLRAVSFWRYQARLYGFPLELRLMHRLFHYQRPETTGF